MTDYDSMSVKELLEQYVHDAEIRWDDYGQIEAAIRRVVIREASVGTIAIRFPAETSGYQVDHFTLTHEERAHEWNEYVLVPSPEAT